MITLQPLSEEEAMLVLWRMKETLDTEEVSDKVANVQLERFEQENSVEFGALQELCVSDWSYSLAELPLALVQAGAYIRHRGFSFSKYLQLYRESSMKVKLSHMMRKTEELAPVREEQRAILNTWKISVDVLSPEAFFVLRAASMLGNAPISEHFFKTILNEVIDADDVGLEEQYSKVVLHALAFGSSLVRMTSAIFSSEEAHPSICGCSR